LSGDDNIFPNFHAIKDFYASPNGKINFGVDYIPEDILFQISDLVVEMEQDSSRFVDEYDIFEVFLTSAAVKSINVSNDIDDRVNLEEYETKIAKETRNIERQNAIDNAKAHRLEAAMLKAEIKAYKDLKEYENYCLKHGGSPRAQIKENAMVREFEIDRLKSEYRAAKAQIKNDKLA
jgi:hypothetical protein